MAEQRLIDAEAFHKFIEKQDEGADYTIYHFKEWLEQQPIIEAKPVVHAHWIYGETIYGVEWMKCSACCKSQTPTGVFSYCPNCGAQMDEEERLK